MKKTKNSYKKSGVNIETADKFTKYIARYSKQAFKRKKKFLAARILEALDLYITSINLKLKDPLLVSATDGVGTKLD